MYIETATVFFKYVIGYMISPKVLVTTANLPLRKTHTATTTITYQNKLTTTMNVKVEINGQTFVYSTMDIRDLPFQKHFFYDSHEIVFNLKLVSDKISIGFKYRESDSDDDFNTYYDEDDTGGDFDPLGVGGKGYDPHKYDYILDKIRKKY